MAAPKFALGEIQWAGERIGGMPLLTTPEVGSSSDSDQS